MTKHAADRLTVLRLAAEADVDPRSAAKALRDGPRSLRGRAGEKAEAAMKLLEIAVTSGCDFAWFQRRWFVFGGVPSARQERVHFAYLAAKQTWRKTVRPGWRTAFARLASSLAIDLDAADAPAAQTIANWRSEIRPPAAPRRRPAANGR